MATRKGSFLYSVGTELAFLINKKYYNNVHYVWCTTNFHDPSQPGTSDPQTLCKRWINVIHAGDRHDTMIEQNVAGIQRGVYAKFGESDKTQELFKQIQATISLHSFENFWPVIYIIDRRKTASHSFEALLEEKACSLSREYKIEALKPREFEVIHLKEILNDEMDISEECLDKKIANMLTASGCF